MSYSVEVPTTTRGPSTEVAVTTFYGGKDDGRCVQIMLSGPYAQLTMTELDELIEVLTFARGRTLADHPKCTEFEREEIQ